MQKREILELFKRFGAEITADDVWNVQQATVIKHKALERLAASAGIEWDAPIVLRCERDEAVILVTGKLGERAEWSIGEALINANYRVSGKQAPYVYAMAEKRAKDRVIIKLCGLHGLYSEDEADEFKEQPANTAKPATPPPPKQETAPIIQGSKCPEGVDPDLWGTVMARVDAGIEAYADLWKNDLTAAERQSLMKHHEKLKAIAERHGVLAA